MDELKREIKEALLGDLVPTADGRLAVSFTRRGKYRNGLGDGYDKVLILGVMCRRRWYLSRKNAKQMRELAAKGMQNMGRMMSLSAEPDMEAVYCSYLLNPPAIVTYQRGKDGVIEVDAYSARGFGGWFACFRSLNRFQKNVPEVLQRMSEEDEKGKQTAIREQDAQDRLRIRQAKKERKQEKKRLRKEKRREHMQSIVGVLPKLPKFSAEDKASQGRIWQKETEEDISMETAMNASAEEQAVGASVNAEEPGYSDGAVNIAVEKQNVAANASGEEAIDAMRAEQARLEAEAERAKLAAQAAQAKLEAAQAKLEAEEAQAKLAEVEAKLTAAQTSKSEEARASKGEVTKQNNHKNSGNVGNKKRRKKK